MSRHLSNSAAAVTLSDALNPLLCYSYVRWEHWTERRTLRRGMTRPEWWLEKKKKWKKTSCFKTIISTKGHKLRKHDDSVRPSRSCSAHKVITQVGGGWGGELMEEQQQWGKSRRPWADTAVGVLRVQWGLVLPGQMRERLLIINII